MPELTSEQQHGWPLTRIALVACAKTKLNQASHLLNLSRTFVERACRDGQSILSAHHGLLLPDEVVAPYDATLTRMPIAARKAWSTRAWTSIRSKWSPEETGFVLLAGVLDSSAVELSKHVERSLPGVSLAQRASHFKRANAEPRP